jgi:hypothetical protein
MHSKATTKAPAAQAFRLALRRPILASRVGVSTN